MLNFYVSLSIDSRAIFKIKTYQDLKISEIFLFEKIFSSNQFEHSFVFNNKLPELT